MGAKSKRLQLVLKLFQKQEDQVAQMLSKLKSQLQQEQQKLEQLYSYQTQYHQQFEQKAIAGINSRDFITQQQFLEQLQQVTQSQQKGLNEQAQYMTTVQEKWMSLYLKRKNFEKLIKKIQKNEQIQLDKQEQKLIDELVSQIRLQ